MRVEVLQGLHEAPAHVARLRGLHGGVHEALPARHGVEEELRGREAAVEAVGHKAPAVRRPAMRKNTSVVIDGPGERKPYRVGGACLCNVQLRPYHLPDQYQACSETEVRSSGGLAIRQIRHLWCSLRVMSNLAELRTLLLAGTRAYISMGQNVMHSACRMHGGSCQGVRSMRREDLSPTG